MSTQLCDTLSINIQEAPIGNERSESPNLIQAHENEAQGRHLDVLQGDIRDSYQNAFDHYEFMESLVIAELHYERRKFICAVCGKSHDE